jgi:hypothetical protein
LLKRASLGGTQCPFAIYYDSQRVYTDNVSPI